MYPGSGQVTKNFSEMIYIYPKGEGRPTFSDVKNRDQYSSDLYNVVDIPTQEQLLYTVGIFQGWEDIVDTQDKYVLVKNPATGTIEKHRVAFQE